MSYWNIIFHLAVYHIYGIKALKKHMIECGYGGYEIHHKLSTSLGGNSNDSLENLILITRADHMLVHVLLSMMFANQPLVDVVHFYNAEEVVKELIAGDDNIAEMVSSNNVAVRMQLSKRLMGNTYSLGSRNAAKDATHFKRKVCKNLKSRDDYTKDQWGHRNNYLIVLW
jgi:hypothetical protein